MSRISRPYQNKEEYNLAISQKRRLHQDYGTTLIETFHFDWVEGNLENRLATLMLEQGVALQPISQDDLFNVLRDQGFIQDQAARYLKCLQAIRVERLERDAVFKRIQSKKIAMAKAYTELLDGLHQAYRAKLVADQRIDFDDMILKATQQIVDGQFTPHWQHILVDEFQDISMSRMELLAALIKKGSNPILTAVGDDWQSIYRFSGGKLELTTQFDTFVGRHSLTKLEKTFRYNNSIADTAGTFVMQNPRQYQKLVVTETQVTEPQVYLMDSLVNGEDAYPEKVCQIIRTIRQNDPHGSIAVLGRYRYFLDNARQVVKTQQLLTNVDFWTFHGSKGLEADYCILVGLNHDGPGFQGRGFPSHKSDELIVEALLPTLDEFPFSEERRLMYVAITRAKKKCYILSDSCKPSEFIEELLGGQYCIHVVSDSFQVKDRQLLKCPVCQGGYFQMLTGLHGDFYKCSNATCSIRPRVCEQCGSPSIDRKERSVCQNQTCSFELPLCERCGRTLKVRKNKQGVAFWGCSGFGLPNDSCDFTKPKNDL